MKNNLVGQRFGKLVINEILNEKYKKKGTMYSATCDCGTIIKVTQAGIKSRKSCGCNNRQIRPHKRIAKLDIDIVGLNRVLNHYKKSAHTRNKIFDLNKEEFYNLIKQNCSYCNNIPNNCLKFGKNRREFYYNGIDRIDNNLGYNISNCVSCCKICNRAKSIMTIEEFKKWAKSILTNSVQFSDISNDAY
jgi:hypothetical protein